MFSHKEMITVPGDGYVKYLNLVIIQCTHVWKHHTESYDMHNYYSSIQNKIKKFNYSHYGCWYFYLIAIASALLLKNPHTWKSSFFLF
jgi:hypothetical protein